MDKLILSYLQAEERLRIAREKVASSLALAQEAARPTGALRVATPADIVVGALLWYEREEDGDEGNPHYWCIVEDVLRPSDAWKAFTAHDGCRYGLDGAMIEILDHIGDPNEQA